MANVNEAETEVTVSDVDAFSGKLHTLADLCEGVAKVANQAIAATLRYEAVGYELENKQLAIEWQDIRSTLMHMDFNRMRMVANELRAVAKKSKKSNIGLSSN